MTNRGGNDDNAGEGSLAHNAGWGDVWAGLLLTLFLLGSAALVAILFSHQPSRLPTGDEPVAVHTKDLQGLRDPSRPGWRTAVTPWDLMGIHERRRDVEDRVRGEAMEERAREEQVIETSIADVWQARPR
jgi:hypothetical protein